MYLEIRTDVLQTSSFLLFFFVSFFGSFSSPISTPSSSFLLVLRYLFPFLVGWKIYVFQFSLLTRCVCRSRGTFCLLFFLLVFFYLPLSLASFFCDFLPVFFFLILLRWFVEVAEIRVKNVVKIFLHRWEGRGADGQKKCRRNAHRHTHRE